MCSIKFACASAMAVFLSVPTIGLAESAPGAVEQGEIVGMDLPVNVKKQADRMTTNVNWLFAFKFSNGGQPFYRILAKDVAQHTLLVEVTADGKPRYLRTALSFQELPEAVRRGLKAFQPNFEPKTGFMDIQSVGINDRVALYYQISGTLPNHQEAVFLVLPDGTRVVNNKDMEALAAAKRKARG